MSVQFNFISNFSMKKIGVGRYYIITYQILISYEFKQT